jgi:hypothetical protein
LKAFVNSSGVTFSRSAASLTNASRSFSRSLSPF